MAHHIWCTDEASALQVALPGDEDAVGAFADRYELAFWEMAYTKGRSDRSRDPPLVRPTVVTEF